MCLDLSEKRFAHEKPAISYVCYLCYSKLYLTDDRLKSIFMVQLFLGG